MHRFENPCYDRNAKTSCPRRHEGCAVDCPEWAEYLKKRDAEYKKRDEMFKVENIRLCNLNKIEHKAQLRYLRKRRSRK